jgi:TPR repeat protein
MLASAAAAAAASEASPVGGPPPPEAFLCPISQDLMSEPVIAADGHSYERTEIEQWFATGRQTSPMTNSTMATQTLVSNHVLKSQIKEWQSRSSAQRAADLIATVMLTDDQKEIERKLGALAGFIGHSKAVVQPQTLQKLGRVLADGSRAVQEALRAVEAECRLVAVGFAARLRDERRDQRLATSAVAGGKSKLVQLDIDISAAEEALRKLKAGRETQAEYVSELELVEQECVSSVAQLEEKLNGYPESLGLLEEEEAQGQKAASETAAASDEEADNGQQQASAKRKWADDKGVQGTVVAKRRRGFVASIGSSDGVDDCESLMREGLDWFHGRNFRVRNEARGRLLIEAASTAGLPLAVAYCKSKGWGGHDADHEATFDILRKAAEQGDSTAQLNVGWCYAKGEGVEKDLAEAVAWFRKAAEQGNSTAQCSLGMCYTHGQGVEKDMTEAAAWYRKAAEQGDSKAQCSLGMCYAKGQGVEKDMTEAAAWYRKAAEQGDSRAQVNLGWCYTHGEGVEKDLAEAVAWYRKAAEQGNIKAQFNLGCCYAKGQGVEKDQAEAAAWCRKAAEQGDSKAQVNLGNCYAHGEGVEKDPAEAVAWYRKAAEQGDKIAQRKLTEMF